ncbi:MAG: transglutaminaseTgpA domain-containing protein [Holophaga sp.]|nr:transglutaminaseTgpA domain-containing protein [Holophaga sp.]
MKSAPWLDHLPPWLAWGALVSTGAYAPGELALMALPLLAGALVQWRGWALDGWRRGLEFASVAALVILGLLRLGLLMTVVYMLFLLCGVRLCLPRAVPQRRQLLLMGFLLFLTTAVTTADLDFLLWSMAWVAGASAVLMQLNWEKSAMLRQGPYLAPPHFRVLPWSLAALAMGSGFFVLLPRLRMGLSHLPASVQGVGGLQTGLSDVLDLSGVGPIQTNREVAMRILPSGKLSVQARRDYGSALGLLRGFTLERLEGQRWVVDPDTPRRGLTQWTQSLPQRPVQADLFVGPDLMGVIPLPYGQADLEPSPGDALRFGRGASLRWVFPVRRTTALHLALSPGALEPEAPPRGQRLGLLTDTGQDTGSARDWSWRAVPAALPPRELAERLTQALRASFRYTLDNPSGGASNPLQDFLEHSRAGECEYFASALAFMLRHRGVPARVAVGYRLGPWIEEGGYFLVTQAQAHSWVEYYDPAAGGWRSADPTPAAPPSRFDARSLLAALSRWSDIVRFSWDRDVVRFSDEDQMAGAGWALVRFQAMSRWRPGPALRILAGLAVLAAQAWFGGRPLSRRWRRTGSGSCGPCCAGPGAPCRPCRARPPGPGWPAWRAGIRTGPPSWTFWPGKPTRWPTAGNRGRP